MRSLRCWYRGEIPEENFMTSFMGFTFKGLGNRRDKLQPKTTDVTKSSISRIKITHKFCNIFVAHLSQKRLQVLTAANPTAFAAKGEHI
jgi:hypothetical protein